MSRHRHLATWREDPKTYDLRHARARVHTIPTIKPFAVAAEMMGHAEKIHKATYLRWTKKEDLKRRLSKSWRHRAWVLLGSYDFARSLVVEGVGLPDSSRASFTEAVFVSCLIHD